MIRFEINLFLFIYAEIIYLWTYCVVGQVTHIGDTNLVAQFYSSDAFMKRMVTWWCFNLTIFFFKSSHRNSKLQDKF